MTCFENGFKVSAPSHTLRTRVYSTVSATVALHTDSTVASTQLLQHDMHQPHDCHVLPTVRLSHEFLGYSAAQIIPLNHSAVMTLLLYRAAVV